MSKEVSVVEASIRHANLEKKVHLPIQYLEWLRILPNIEMLVEILTFLRLAARNMCIIVTAPKRHETEP